MVLTGPEAPTGEGDSTKGARRTWSSHKGRIGEDRESRESPIRDLVTMSELVRNSKLIYRGTAEGR